MTRDFSSLLKKRECEGKHICVGLEPVLHSDAATFPFIRDIVDSVSDLVCAFKINPAPFFARGDDGFRMLLLTASHIISSTDVPVILDMKCGDVDAMNKRWKQFAFDTAAVDAIIVSPWGGFDSMDCFFGDTLSKGIFIWCRSSFSEYDGPQMFPTNMIRAVYERVITTAVRRWGKFPGFGVVIGSVGPHVLSSSRCLIGDKAPILVPGVGYQGGTISEVVPAVANSSGGGFIVNVGRSVIDFSRGGSIADMARRNVAKLNNEVVSALQYR